MVTSGEYEILDVRKPGEYESEHLVQAIHAPLDYINESMLHVHPDKKYVVHCAGGYRSMIFASILKARGYHNLVDVKGGFKAIKDAGILPATAFVCPSSLL